MRNLVRVRRWKGEGNNKVKEGEWKYKQTNENILFFCRIIRSGLTVRLRTGVLGGNIIKQIKRGDLVRVSRGERFRGSLSL